MTDSSVSPDRDHANPREGKICEVLTFRTLLLPEEIAGAGSSEPFGSEGERGLVDQVDAENDNA